MASPPSMTPSALLAVIPESRLHAEPAIETPLTGVAYNTGRISSGDVFACLPGEKVDGHDFAGTAVEAGAAALIVERPLDLPVPQLVVPDARLATALAAGEFFGRPSDDIDVVGITGTNGKTTTAYLVHAIVEASGQSCGLLGTVEARIGGEVESVSHTTPESVDLQQLLARMRDAGDAVCAMEVSSHALVQRRVAGTRFAAALFSNLTRDHLDYHDSVEDYYAAKRRLFVRPDHEGSNPPAAVNLDDEFGARLAAEVGALGYAVDSPADVHPQRAVASERGWNAEFATPRGPLAIETALRGAFNLSNVAAAVAAGELLELPHDAIAAGIAGLPGVPGRFEAIEVGQPFTVLVDYAHTPDSVENVLRAARPLAERGRLLVVFGCGGDRDAGKRGPMGTAARTLADVAIVTSDNPRGEDPHDIIREIVADSQGHAELIVEPDRRAAIEIALSAAAPGDVVVVAGKGHEQGQDIAGVITPFDDRDVVREILGGSQ